MFKDVNVISAFNSLRVAPRNTFVVIVAVSSLIIRRLTFLQETGT